MCGPKEPIAGVFVLLLLAAGGWAAQEPIPHSGIEVLPEPQMSSKALAEPMAALQLQSVTLDIRLR